MSSRYLVLTWYYYLLVPVLYLVLGVHNCEYLVLSVTADRRDRVPGTPTCYLLLRVPGTYLVCGVPATWYLQEYLVPVTWYEFQVLGVISIARVIRIVHIIPSSHRTRHPHPRH